MLGNLSNVTQLLGGAYLDLNPATLVLESMLLTTRCYFLNCYLSSFIAVFNIADWFLLLETFYSLVFHAFILSSFPPTTCVAPYQSFLLFPPFQI